MGKFIKKLMVGIFCLLLLAVAVVAYLIYGIDPNNYKPELHALANDNGIELNIEGDIAWALFPTLAIRVGETDLSGKGIPAIRFEKAALALDWKALLKRQVSFSAITIDGAQIQISSEAEAKTLAAAPAIAAPPETTTPATGAEMPFQVAIRDLKLNDSRISYLAEDGTTYVLENVNFSSSHLNLEESPFPIRLELDTMLPESISGAADKPTSLTFAADLSLNLEQQRFQLTDARLQTKVPDSDLRFSARYDGAANSLDINSLSGSLPSGEIEAQLQVTDLNTSAKAVGSVKVTDVSLRKLLKEPPEGIDLIGFDADLEADEKNIRLASYNLSLDDFSGSGSASLSLDAPRQLKLTFNGSELNLPSTPTQEGAAETSGALLTPLLAPLALLDGGKGQIEAGLQGLKSGQYDIRQPKINLTVNGKVVEIANLSGGIYGGQFQLSAKADLRGKMPEVNFSTRLNRIELAKAIPDNQDLTGVLDFSFNGKTRGDQGDELLDNLAGEGSYTVTGPRVNNLNVEKSYCEMAALVEGRGIQQKSWPSYTQLDDLSGNLRIKQQVITLPAYTTRLGNIAIKGKGNVNLLEQSYDMLISANLQGDTTSATGCTVKSKSVRNRDIPFRCVGSFAAEGGGMCAPDKSFITGLLQEKLVDKFFKLPEEKLPLEEGAQVPGEESLEEEVELEDQLKEKAIDSVLKGLFSK